MKTCSAFIFSGPPGCGKGSLSQLCVSELGWQQVSTGALCRQQIEKKTEIGNKIDLIINSGRLIPDSLMTQMVNEWLIKHTQEGRPVILDGYPRTVGQAEAFHALSVGDLFPLRVMIVQFVIEDDIVVKRLSSRRTCLNKECQAVYSVDPESMLLPKQEGICDICESVVGQREDDVPEIIRDRLRVYHQHEQKLLNFYKHVGYKIITIDANQPLRDMFHQFRREIDGLVL